MSLWKSTEFLILRHWLKILFSRHRKMDNTSRNDRTGENLISISGFPWKVSRDSLGQLTQKKQVQQRLVCNVVLQSYSQRKSSQKSLVKLLASDEKIRKQNKGSWSKVNEKALYSLDKLKYFQTCIYWYHPHEMWRRYITHVIKKTIVKAIALMKM